MENKTFSKEEILNALRQAEANINFEEIDIFDITPKEENNKLVKLKRKDNKYGR